jgi:hypothetical protein
MPIKPDVNIELTVVAMACVILIKLNAIQNQSEKPNK